MEIIKSLTMQRKSKCMAKISTAPTVASKIRRAGTNLRVTRVVRVIRIVRVYACVYVCELATRSLLRVQCSERIEG